MEILYNPKCFSESVNYVNTFKVKLDFLTVAQRFSVSHEAVTKTNIILPELLLHCTGRCFKAAAGVSVISMCAFDFYMFQKPDQDRALAYGINTIDAIKGSSPHMGLCLCEDFKNLLTRMLTLSP